VSVFIPGSGSGGSGNHIKGLYGIELVSFGGLGEEMEFRMALDKTKEGSFQTSLSRTK
jgi:hypothetical protein